MSETDLQRRIQLAVSAPDVRLWRNSVGEAWLGRTFSIRDGRLVSGKASRVRFGLAPGSSDLIGLRSAIITPEMVGRRVAIFAAVEVKGERTPTMNEQAAFVRMVIEQGGLAGFARSERDALDILSVDRMSTVG